MNDAEFRLRLMAIEAEMKAIHELLERIADSVAPTPEQLEKRAEDRAFRHAEYSLRPWFGAVNAIGGPDTATRRGVR